MATMPLVLTIFCFLLCVQVSNQQKQTHKIRLGSSIFPTTQPTSWPSPSGRFAFGFYRHGNGFAVGIWLVTPPANTVVWTANRNHPPLPSNSTLKLTRRGKLLLQSEQGNQNLIVDVSDPAGSASMLESGNFVLYDRRSSVIWQSFDFPTDTLLGGQKLTSGDKLVSGMSRLDHSAGRFWLSMQGDGNLVAYPVNSSNGPDDSYWCSNTPWTEFDQLRLDYRGMLYLTGREHKKIILANSSSSAKRKLTVVYRATLDADGIFKLYSHHFSNTSSTTSMSLEWSALQDPCDVKGFCGFNSYCSSPVGDCDCYPGFDAGNQTVKFHGCIENYTYDVCLKDLLQVQYYNMTAVENLRLDDYPYYVAAGMMTKQDCSMSCENDCNCGAVVYDGKDCKRYKFPLRYGKRSQSISATAFFKVVSAGSSRHDRPPFPLRPQVKNNDSSLVRILAISLGSTACLCFALAITTFSIYRLRVHSYRKLSENGNLGLSEEFSLRSFSYREIEKATNDFEEELGRGSFGAFYKGTIPEDQGNKTIAVKRLEKAVEDGERQFITEMAAIGRTHHKNLVRLLGFCVEGCRKLLVYEFMSNGSVADVLFEASNSRRPNWKERVKIALDVARGILYLHEECEIHIIHCNIKPQNVLLDDSWTAKLSDFGLAKLLVPNQSKTAKCIPGTRGYSAPEWQRNALISEKVDIYSYGVVLLEIICCRSSIDITNVSAADEIILSSWVYNCFVAGELDKVVEEDESIDMKTLERMVKVSLWCIQEDPALRPPIKNVILMLEGTMDVPVPPCPAFSITI